MANRKTASAAWMIGVSMLVACGHTRNVRNDGPPASAGDGGEGATQPGELGGSSGDSSGLGGGGSSGLGGGGSSGAAGTPTVGGGTLTWDPRQCHPAAVPEPTDVTLKARWAAARAFCDTLRKQDCFQTGVILQPPDCTAEQMLDSCVTQALWSHDQSIPAACEAAWTQVFECGAKAGSDPGLCAESNLIAIPNAPSGTCAQQNAELMDCWRQHGGDEQPVVGSYTQCFYANTSPTSCDVRCPVGPQTATLSCSGQEGLPKQCTCQINGHPTFAYDLLFVNDCGDAARQAADGLCSGLLDCCFKYVDDTKPACFCADPIRYGYDSCQAMMAVAAGERVDICPQLLPTNAPGAQDGCWPPGACKL